MNQQSLPFSSYSYLPRPDRLEQIYEVLARQSAPLTLAQVARLIGLRKSNHVRGMLEEMVMAGDLVHGPEFRHPNGHIILTYLAPLPF